MKSVSDGPHLALSQVVLAPYASDLVVSRAGAQGWSATSPLVARRGQALLQRLWKVQLPKGRPVGEGTASSFPAGFMQLRHWTAL